MRAWANDPNMTIRQKIPFPEWAISSERARGLLGDVCPWPQSLSGLAVENGAQQFPKHWVGLF